MSGTHDHGSSGASARSLSQALALTAGFLLVEVIGGLLTGSLALLSDAAHMMTDTAGLAIALAGVKIGQQPADNKRTFGYKRFEILAAAANAILLFAVAGYILYEGYQRLTEGSEVQSLPMLLIAALGLFVNFVAMRLLGQGKTDNLNVRGAYLEVYSDMLGSIGVIAAAAIIWMTGWNWVDALVAIGIGLWVLPRTWQLLKETTNILLEGVPDGIDPARVTSTLRGIAGVRGIHDLHIWAITSGEPSLSAHLVLCDGADPDAVRAAAAVKLDSEHGIEHVTLQTERIDCRDGREHHGLH